jgi:hypothetical protein
MARICIRALPAFLFLSLMLGQTAAPAHAQPTEIIGLFAGCNNVSLTWPNGTEIATVAAAVNPADAVIAIWRFGNAERRFSGFAPSFPAASDLRTINTLDPVFICVGRTANLTRPSIGTGPRVPTPPPAPM